jgi:hypothetical protein
VKEAEKPDIVIIQWIARYHLPPQQNLQNRRDDKKITPDAAAESMRVINYA